MSPGGMALVDVGKKVSLPPIDMQLYSCNGSDVECAIKHKVCAFENSTERVANKDARFFLRTFSGGRGSSPVQCERFPGWHLAESVLNVDTCSLLGGDLRTPITSLSASLPGGMPKG